MNCNFTMILSRTTITENMYFNYTKQSWEEKHLLTKYSPISLLYSALKQKVLGPYPLLPLLAISIY